MHGLNKASAVLAAATLLLAGCGGGGGGSTPHVPTQAATTAPSATNRTVVGTARLALALPKVVTAKGTNSAVRAIPHGAARALPRGVARSPKYVNPSPNPGQPPCNGNVLDIYVDGVLLPALDNGSEAPDSLCVVQSTDGTQTVSVPLFSTNANQIVAVEWDSVFENVLAIGETDYGSFAAGNTINVSLTMQMNAEWIGITDLGFNDPVLMQSEPWSFLSGPCPGTSQFAVFAADATGTFVPIAGYGGTATPQVTGSPASGTTSLGQSTIAGVYNVAWDNSCDALDVSANVQNPANGIWSDVYYGYGDYPGLQYLYNSNQTSGDGQNFQNWWFQLDDNSIEGSVQVENDG